MSDLKNFLWNNQTLTSIKKKYHNKVLSLNEWPDFGFVGCPKEYIVLSAYLVKQPLEYGQLKELSASSEDVINHFIYVCTMLKIITIKEKENSSHIDTFLNVLSTGISLKLKKLFF